MASATCFHLDLPNDKPSVSVHNLTACDGILNPSQPFWLMVCYVLWNVVLGDHLSKQILLGSSCSWPFSRNPPHPFPRKAEENVWTMAIVYIICKPEFPGILWKDSPISYPPEDWVKWAIWCLSSSPRQLHDVPTHLPRNDHVNVRDPWVDVDVSQPKTVVKKPCSQLSMA